MEAAGREEGPGEERALDRGGDCAVVTWPQPPPAWGCSSGLEAPRRGAGARVCQRGVPSQPAAAPPPCQGERQGGGSPGALLGRSWGRGAGLVQKIPAPAEKETCQGAEGGGVGSDPGTWWTLGSLGPGRRTVPRGPPFLSRAGATWKQVGDGGFENCVFAEGRKRGVSCAGADFGALWGGGSCTGLFQVTGWKEGRRS